LPPTGTTGSSAECGRLLRPPTPPVRGFLDLDAAGIVRDSSSGTNGCGKPESLHGHHSAASGSAHCHHTCVFASRKEKALRVLLFFARSQAHAGRNQLVLKKATTTSIVEPTTITQSERAWTRILNNNSSGGCCQHE